MADVTVTKPDGSKWLIDDTLLVRALPTEPDDGSYVTINTVTGIEEWHKRIGLWSPVENPLDTHAWAFVVARDIGLNPAVSYSSDDRGFLRKLITHLPVDGASVVTVEAHRLRCQSNVPGSNVTIALGATVEHLSKTAAVRYALGLLGAVGGVLS